MKSRDTVYAVLAALLILLLGLVFVDAYTAYRGDDALQTEYAR